MGLLNPELVLGWGVLALINGEVAVTRERSRWRWMAVSALLGPAATFVLVLLPDRSRAEPAPTGPPAA